MLLNFTVFFILKIFFFIFNNVTRFSRVLIRWGFWTGPRAASHCLLETSPNGHIWWAARGPVQTAERQSKKTSSRGGLSIVECSRTASRLWGRLEEWFGTEQLSSGQLVLEWSGGKVCLLAWLLFLGVCLFSCSQNSLFALSDYNLDILNTLAWKWFTEISGTYHQFNILAFVCQR